MSRAFKVSNDWYGDNSPKMYKKRKITIKEGVTVLVGCNGAGKTTLLRQMESQLKADKIPV